MTDVWVQVEWEEHHTEIGHIVISEEELNELKSSPEYPDNLRGLEFDTVEYGELISISSPISVTSTIEDDEVELFERKDYVYVTTSQRTSSNIPEVYISPVFDSYKDCEEAVMGEIDQSTIEVTELNVVDIVLEGLNCHRKWISRDEYGIMTYEIQEIV